MLAPDTSIAIVGGGAAGLMAASAAQYLGARVTIFERTDQLLPLQDGNRTRWLHPHIYNWPAPKSTDPWAGLPLLDWHAGSAGDVASQLLASWHRQQSSTRRPATIQFDSTVTNVWESSGGWRLNWRRKEEAASTTPFGVVILAVGFGMERQTSYWRNDSLDQSHLRFSEAVPKYLVTGCGDGGLVDWLRLQLRGFRQDEMISLLGENNERLFAALQDLDEKAHAIALNHVDSAKSEREVGAFLNDQYASIVAEDLDNILKSRLRTDVHAYLNGPHPHPYSLRASRLNRFMVHRVLRVRHNYRSGVAHVGEAPHLATPDRTSVTFGEGSPEGFDHIIRRHGPQSALATFMPAVFAKTGELRTLNALDQTAFPMWSRGETFGPEGDAGAKGPAPATLDKLTFMSALSPFERTVLGDIVHGVHNGELFSLVGSFERHSQLHVALQSLQARGLIQPKGSATWEPGAEADLTWLGGTLLLASASEPLPYPQEGDADGLGAVPPSQVATPAVALNSSSGRPPPSATDEDQEEDIEASVLRVEDTPVFFNDRLSDAFPGVRGLKECQDPAEISARLQVLLQEPLTIGRVRPLWEMDFGSMHIHSARFEAPDIVFLGWHRYRVKRIAAYRSMTYWRSFLILEWKADEQTGAYPIRPQDDIDDTVEMLGHCTEEYGLWKGGFVTREEYDDGAIFRDGKSIPIRARLEVRQLAPGALLIAGQRSAVHDQGFDIERASLLKAVVAGKLSLDQLVKRVEQLSRHRRDEG